MLGGCAPSRPDRTATNLPRVPGGGRAPCLRKIGGPDGIRKAWSDGRNPERTEDRCPPRHRSGNPPALGFPCRPQCSGRDCRPPRPEPEELVLPGPDRAVPADLSTALEIRQGGGGLKVDEARDGEWRNRGRKRKGAGEASPSSGALRSCNRGPRHSKRFSWPSPNQCDARSSASGAGPRGLPSCEAGGKRSVRLQPL